MKSTIYVIILLLVYCNVCISQNNIQKQLENIEKSIKESSIPGGYTCTAIDIDNDGDVDYIITYQTAEPRSIRVYMNVNGKLEKVIDEFTGSIEYEIAKYGELENMKNRLVCTLGHCCGESYYHSVRSFEFENDQAILKENYVEFDAALPLDYAKQTDVPLRFWKTTVVYSVMLEREYNVRYFPSVDKFTPRNEYEKQIAGIACIEGTNIIVQVNKGVVADVLYEMPDSSDERKWLLVEIPNQYLTGNCNPVDFGFEGQKLRGWISDKYVTKVNMP